MGQAVEMFYRKVFKRAVSFNFYAIFYFSVSSDKADEQEQNVGVYFERMRSIYQFNVVRLR